MRVLHVQYTNPAVYPPLVRGAELLAEAGAEVLMLGIRVPGTDVLTRPSREGIEVHLLSPAPVGWRLKAHYARYAAWVAREAAVWRPDWVYASDVLSAPVALAIAAITGARVVYHEHDAPSLMHESWMMRRCLAARQRLVGRADVVVTPNVERSARLARIGKGRPVLTAWNCPRRPVSPLPARGLAHTLRMVFRGSINSERLPLSVIDALARVPGPVTLDVAGYETVGSRGYVAALEAFARRVGVAERVRLLGAVPEDELNACCARSDVGLALMPMQSSDENMQHMTGASNKVFEYLSCGVTPLVSDLPDWRATFVSAGVALACDPRDAGSIASALAWAAGHRRTLRAMAERGRERLLADWNYETQFAPVLEAMLRARPTARVAIEVEEAQCAS